MNACLLTGLFPVVVNTAAVFLEMDFDVTDAAVEVVSCNLPNGCGGAERKRRREQQIVHFKKREHFAESFGG